MKRLAVALLAAVVAATAVIAAAEAKGPKPNTNRKTKVGVCHKGAGTSATHPYVAINVPTKAALNQHLRHPADVIVSSSLPGATALPSGMTMKRFCRSLTPLTARSGGQAKTAALTSTTVGLSGNLAVRLRLGQGQLCYALTVTSATSPVTVTAASLTQGSLTVSLTLPASASGTSPLTLTKCVTVPRTTVESLLTGSATITASVTTSAGTLTGTVS
jgi:hypothetical protein